MSIILVIVVTVLTIIGGVCIYHFSERLNEKSKTIKLLQDDAQALLGSVSVLDEKVHGMDQKIQHMQQRIDQLSLKEPSQQTYHHAVKLVKSGACINDVVESCGLSRGEAELIMLFNKMDASELVTEKSELR